MHSMNHLLSIKECETLIRFATRHGCREMPKLWSPQLEQRSGTKINIEQVFKLNEKMSSTTKEEDTAAKQVLLSFRTRIAKHFHIDNCDDKYGNLSSCQISFTPPETGCMYANSPTIGLHVCFLKYIVLAVSTIKYIILVTLLLHIYSLFHGITLFSHFYSILHIFTVSWDYSIFSFLLRYTG